MFQLVPPHVPLRDLLQKDLFGERLITINAEQLNQSQLTAFQERMQDLQQMSMGTMSCQCQAINRAFSPLSGYQIAAPKKPKKQRIVEEIGDGEALLNGTAVPEKNTKFDNKKWKGVKPVDKEKRRESRGTNKRSNNKYGGGRFEPEQEEETVAAYNVSYRENS